MLQVRVEFLRGRTRAANTVVLPNLPIYPAKISFSVETRSLGPFFGFCTSIFHTLNFVKGMPYSTEISFSSDVSFFRGIRTAHWSALLFPPSVIFR